MPGSHINDAQMRLFMTYTKTHRVETASAKAGFSTSTGYRILRDPRLPSQKKAVRGRRRPDPLAEFYESDVVPMLEASPGLRAVSIFRELDKLYPGKIDKSLRRTLERRVRRWKAEFGPDDKEVMFRQTKEAGHFGFSDFTSMNKFGVTIAGEKLDHKLYHFRLPWSGFTYVQLVCGGESFTALAEGLQNALWSLGGAPREHRTDSLSAAFKNLSSNEEEDQTARYRSLCKDYRMTPSRNNPGKAHENGAIEAPHRHLKQEFADALALRRSRDFASLDEYRAFIATLAGQINARKKTAIDAERKTLQELPERRSTDYDEASVKVSSSSGFTLRRVFYTAPSRLIGMRLTIRIYDDRLEVFLGDSPMFECPRKPAKHKAGRAHVVNYRHVISSLKTKPGALLRLVYRDEIFPRDAYRLCFERAQEQCDDRRACRLAVELLALAHEENCEAALAAEIERHLDAGSLPDITALRARFTRRSRSFPEVNVMSGKLAGYGNLLTGGPS